MEILPVIWALIFLIILRIVHRFLWAPQQRRHRLDDEFQPKTQVEPRFSRQTAREIVGKAYVTDGDGLRVNNVEVRIAGLDAPEFDQIAKHNGRWFNYGRIVKSALIREIGGKEISVEFEKYDKFGRMVGTVRRNGKDIGADLVRRGMAVSAYSDKYKEEEEEARRLQKGQWQFEESFDPRWWRKKEEI